MKPTLIKWIHALIWIRLAAIILLFVLAPLSIVLNSGEGFFQGFAEQMIAMNLGVEGDVVQTLRLIAMSAIIPLLFLIAIFLSLRARKKTLFYIFLCSEIIITLVLGSLPLVPIVILILSLPKSARDYFETSLEVHEENQKTLN